MIKIMFDTVVNARGLYGIYGFGWRMFMGIWDAATTYLMSPHRVWKYNQRNPKTSPPKYDAVDTNATTSSSSRQDTDQHHATLYPTLLPENIPLASTSIAIDNIASAPPSVLSHTSKKPYNKYSNK